MKTQTQEIQRNLTPDDALRLLKVGNQRFINNLKMNRNLLQQVNETSEGQFPFAAILSCMDSRTSAELIFDKGLGDIFSIRVAGNVLNQDILGSMEYACQVAGSKLVVVLGHTRCGAITGACNHVEMGNLTGLIRKIEPAMAMETETVTDRNGDNDTFVENVTKNNICLTMARIRAESEILAGLEASGQIKIAGGLYDVETGQVSFYE